MAVKPKYMVVLPGQFSLDIPYTDRQRVVIVADDQVEAERRWRAGRMLETSESQDEAELAPGDELMDAAEQSPAAIIGRQLRRGLESLQYVGADMAQAVDDRAARWALRHKLGAVMIGRTEAGVLRLDQGHPLTNVLYVGHPARRELYYPAAEFHRRVFEHKFVEAVTLLTSLGASRVAVQQEEGETRDRERSTVAAGLGFSRMRQEQSRSGAEFEAEFPGSGKPFIPDGLCWYPDEQTWKMIAHTRIAGGAQRTSLKVTYTTDYGIDTRVVKASRVCGVNLGGKFQQQRDTIWRLDAEFPSLAA
jgi:hypothetical protein